MKMELRVNRTNIEANEDGSMTVSGYVNKTEQFSEMLGRNEKFKEKISRGAFKRAIEKAKEIHFLAEHDGEKILSSTRNSSLQLSEDANGLYMSATITPTSWGKDYYELIKSGILKNMSFGFRSIKDSWKKVEGYFERTIHELELFEVSVVKDPAYSQSSISARGIDVVEDVEVPAEAKKKIVRNIQEMSRKALIELRNDLFEQSQSYETRGLTEEQEYEQLKSQIRDIEIQLKKIDKKEVRNMIEVEVLTPNDVKVETRGFEEFLKGNLYSEEVRAITTGTAPGQLTVPTSISDQIIKKLEEVAPLFALSKQFPSAHGYLEVLKETGIGGAQWLGEMENATPADFTMSKVKLEQKRLTAAIELSQQLINDAGFDIVSYAINVLSSRIAFSVNRAIVNGNGVGQMEGFLTATLAPESVVKTVAGTVTTDDVLGLFNSMNPELIEGAVFVMNRDTWNKVSKLKDAENRYYLVDFKNGNGSRYYTMLGLPVMISDVMPNIATGNKAIGLINMGEAYGTLIKKGIEVQHVYADSTQALRGSQLIVASIYLDGKIINDQAIRLLSITA